jgi:hypothetical protein
MSRALSRRISDRRVHLDSRVFAADFFAWCADSGTQLDARSNILGNCNFSWRQQANVLTDLSTCSELATWRRTQCTSGRAMESWEIVKAFADIGLVAFVWQLIPVLPCVRVPVFRARRMRAREAAEGWMSCGRRLVAGAAVDDFSVLSSQFSVLSSQFSVPAISSKLLAFSF